jgi:glutathione S-transferase
MVQRVLYGMPFCPLWRKLKFGLLEKRLDVVDVGEKNWAPSVTAVHLNTTGELPIFQDGHIVCGNDYIALEYIESAYGQPGLMGKTPEHGVEIRRLVSWFDRIFYQDVYWSLFYERALKRHMENKGPDTQVLKAGRSLLQGHLKMLNALTDVRTYLDGVGFSWADIAGAAHLSCIDYLGDVAWDHFPALKEWYMKIKSRPAFRVFCMQSFPGLPASLWYGALDF